MFYSRHGCPHHIWYPDGMCFSTECIYQHDSRQSQDIFRAWAFWLPSRRRSEALSRSSIMKEHDWSVSCTETGHNVPEGLDRAPTPPPKDFITISGAQSASDPFQDASLAETQDPQQSDVDVGLETATHRSSLDAAKSLRSSLQSRKGDSVIIIQRPEEAFRKLGEINTV